MNFRDVLILFIGKLFLFLSFLFYFLLLSMPKVQSCDLFVNLITRVNIYSRDTAEERSHLNNRHEFICREKTVGFYVNKWQKSRCWVRFDFITGCMKRHKERFFFTHYYIFSSVGIDMFAYRPFLLPPWYFEQENKRWSPSFLG